MVLMTRAEVKTFNRITATTYDSLIDTYIPIIAEDICEYLNNYFQDNTIYINVSGGLAFTSATSTAAGDLVTDDNQKFSTAGFKKGMDVIIAGGSNSGIYEISSQTSATLRMTSTAKFIAQDQDASYNAVGAIHIARIRWPEAIKPIAAKMIMYLIRDTNKEGVASERIDDYAVTYVNGHAYPSQLLAGLRKWKYVGTR